MLKLTYLIARLHSILWRLGCAYWPFKRFKIGQTITLNQGLVDKHYLITGYGNDDGPVYITKPLAGVCSPYRPYAYYVDKEAKLKE